MACVQEAERCGADRIEPCAVPQEGGLTSSYGMLVSVREATTLPMHPVVHLRGGGFCYTEGKFVAMLNDACMAWELGSPGMVTGVPNVDDQVDIPRMKKVMIAAGPLAVTFHRVSDLCADSRQAWKTLGKLGIKRTPTSGQQFSAEKGISLIMELIAAGDTLIVIAGAGVRAANLPPLLQVGAKEVHSSAGQWLSSEMRFHHPGVLMSTDLDAGEYRRHTVNGEAVTEMKGIISAWRS